MYLSMASIYEKIRLKQKTYWFLTSKTTSPSRLDCRRISHTLCHTAGEWRNQKIREAVEIAKERCAIAHFLANA